jgi:DNA (cytosine-5)-methyltransferase 1
MRKPIKVIDLFAGPGGLGEGFSSYRKNNKQAFKIAISIEKESSAHRTLQLRALFRQYPPGRAPESYYDFLRGDMGKNPEDELYNLPELKEELKEARREAQQITLGETESKLVYKKIKDSLQGDECILIGGPPCQAYSMVGRARNYGAKDKTYSATDDHRNFLYKEYLKVIAKFQPQVFVMENVKGILSAKVDGNLIFDSIRKDLQNPCKSTGETPERGRRKHKYHIYSFVPKSGSLELFSHIPEQDEGSNLDPKDFIIRSEQYGIPQARHRVILLGIRSDVSDSLKDIPLLTEAATRATVEQVISDLPALRSKLSKSEDSTEAWREVIKSIDRKTLKTIDSDSNVPNYIKDVYYQNIKNIENSPNKTGSDKGQKRKVFNKNLPLSLKEWYEDSRLNKNIINHESRGHISGDLHRYLYYSTFASILKKSPKSNNLPEVLWPDHKNFSSGKFSDRFRVQLAGFPGTTVTSHISKDGHYFIHYDPRQCRSLTVREAARIQTFPDNYYFVGNRTEQYVQVGNAVPPYLACQLASVVYNIINNGM